MTKEVLEKYINSRLSSGDIFSDIKSDLAARGYSDIEINEACLGAKNPSQKPAAANINKSNSLNKMPKNALTEKTAKHFRSINQDEPEKKYFSGKKSNFLELLGKCKTFKNSLNQKTKRVFEHKKLLALGSFGIIILLVITYFYSMKVDSIPRTIIVGCVYSLLFFAVIIAKAGMIKAIFSSSKNREMPDFFKQILGIIICADVIMLFILPFTIGLTIWLPVIIGVIFFTLFNLLFLELGIHEIIVSAITYALLNFLILLLIKNVITSAIILRLFT